jgi:hypothetical protein
MDVSKWTRSILTGVGILVLCLVLGIVLDYAITQTLSQFVLSDCSEDCYFRIFNSIFVVVVLLSLGAGAFGGYRAYKRLSTDQ